MVDCTLCSIVGVIVGFIYDIAVKASEYSLLVFAFSFFTAFIIVGNFFSSKFLCDTVRPSNDAYKVCQMVCNNADGSSSSGINGSDDGAGDHYPQRMSSYVENNFDYGIENGPHTWGGDETNQSPVNILDSCVKRLVIREMLTWNHIDDLPLGIMLENNGHTVILKACYSGNTPTVSGADLFACYTFVELCFRWSAWNDEGSEHMINFRKYPLEVQAMHHTGPRNPCTSSFDILMTSYFYEISAQNPFLDPICQNLYRIKNPGSKIEIPPFPISYLCYPFRTNFYSYGGSLTEPPCYQGAEWFIYPEPMAISEQQLNQFRELLSRDGKTRIIRNARPVQPLCSTRSININEYSPIDKELLPDQNDCEQIVDPEYE